MEIFSVLLVLVVAFFAGMESVLDQWQFHQPILNCTMIGIVTGHPVEGVILAGTLQLIALGWMNIGAAMAPDAALAGVSSGIFVCMKGMPVQEAVAVAIPMAVAGLALTIFVRTITVAIAHAADSAADHARVRGVEWAHMLALMIQGLRVAIPAGVIVAIPAAAVQAGLDAIPDWITTGLSTAGGFIVVVGYAMVINMMASGKVWPFFFLGFALASLSELGLVALGIIGVVIALVYVELSPEFNGGGGGGQVAAGNVDPVDAILNDYE